MRSSIAIASLCAAFAAAGPIVKKGVEVATHIDVVTNVVVVTVTAAPVIVTETAGAPAVATVSKPHRHSNSQAAPPPAPTTTSSTVIVTDTLSPPTTTPSAVIITDALSPPTTTSSTVIVTETAAASTQATTEEASSATDALSPTAVTAHNTARASHGATAMTWNQTLADYAAQEGSCSTFAHDLTAGGGGYGQNIAVAGNSNSGAYTSESALADAIKEWYAEESLYGSLYGQPNPSQSVGDFLHFTQIVWLGSHSVGCAVKTCGTDNTIYPGMTIWYSVCNYYPAGNVIGEFNTNVLPS